MVCPRFFYSLCPYRQPLPMEVIPWPLLYLTGLAKVNVYRVKDVPVLDAANGTRTVNALGYRFMVHSVVRTFETHRTPLPVFATFEAYGLIISICKFRPSVSLPISDTFSLRIASISLSVSLSEDFNVRAT